MKANFGARPFAFAEGQQHREAADEADDLTREIRESFNLLPFHTTSDSEDEGTQSAPSTPSNLSDSNDHTLPAGPAFKTVPMPAPLKGLLYSHSLYSQVPLIRTSSGQTKSGANSFKSFTQSHNLVVW